MPEGRLRIQASPGAARQSGNPKSSGMSELSPHQKVNDSGGNGDHEDRERLEVHLEKVISTTYETTPDQNQRHRLDRGAGQRATKRVSQ